MLCGGCSDFKCVREWKLQVNVPGSPGKDGKYSPDEAIAWMQNHGLLHDAGVCPDHGKTGHSRGPMAMRCYEDLEKATDGKRVRCNNTWTKFPPFFSKKNCLEDIPKRLLFWFEFAKGTTVNNLTAVVSSKTAISWYCSLCDAAWMFLKFSVMPTLMPDKLSFDETFIGKRKYNSGKKIRDVSFWAGGCAYVENRKTICRFTEPMFGRDAESCLTFAEECATPLPGTRYDISHDAFPSWNNVCDHVGCTGEEQVIDKKNQGFKNADGVDAAHSEGNFSGGKRRIRRQFGKFGSDVVSAGRKFNWSDVMLGKQDWKDKLQKVFEVLRWYVKNYQQYSKELENHIWKMECLNEALQCEKDDEARKDRIVRAKTCNISIHRVLSNSCFQVLSVHSADDKEKKKHRKEDHHDEAEQIIYEVKIRLLRSEIDPERRVILEECACTCKDFEMHQMCCKHIYFLLMTVFEVPEGNLP